MKETTLRQVVRQILLERIVEFDGTEYDIPDEEIERIKDQLEMGYVGIGMSDEPDDRAYDVEKTVEKLLKDIPDKANKEKLELVFNVYGSSLKDALVKTIYNTDEDIASQLFSIEPTFGDHSFPSSIWNDLVNIHNPGRSNAIGRGEAALGLAIKGVVPDSGSGSHDLEIEGLGGVHVKDTGASGGLKKPDVPMGKGMSSEDIGRPWYQSLKNASAKGAIKLGRGIGVGLLKSNPKAILDEFAALTGKEGKLDYSDLADEWEQDIVDSFLNSESWGDAGAIIFVDKGGLNFSILAPEDAYPTRIENNGWRVGRKDAYPDGRFSAAFKQNLPANESILKAYVSELVRGME